MPSTASDLSRQLARNVEAVCRHYLPAGSRQGGYWIVGDAHGSPGRSLYVRLKGGDQGKGAAGKWTDAESGEHGDLLDLIAINRGHQSFDQTLAEARSFLSLPQANADRQGDALPAKPGSARAARRLFAASKPIRGTLAAAYLRGRAITMASDAIALRFHPHCWYRPDEDDPPGTPTSWPALIASVTDLSGVIMGVHRTWLDPIRRAKAPIATPRKAMGELLGHGIRFGPAGPVMVAGEGIETILSLRECLSLPAIAATSAAHLAAIPFPTGLRRLYVARDSDRAGSQAVANLKERADAAGIELAVLEPQRDDFNGDLVELGRAALIFSLGRQLAREDHDWLFAPSG